MLASRPLFCICFLFTGLFSSAFGTSVSMPFGCVRLPRPPYFYCRLPPGFREQARPEVRFPTTTTTQAPIEVTTLAFEESTTFEPSESTTIMGQETSTPANVYEPESDEVETSTSESLTTPESEEITDVIEETTVPTTVRPTTLSVEAEIMQELRQPPPQRSNGPTIMEEYFIDTLTGGAHHTPPAQLAKALELKSAKQLQRLCRRFLPAARHRCRGEYTHPSYVSQCRGFFDDCGRFVPQADPVYESSRNFQRNVFYGSSFPFSVPIN
uniref:Proteoglycan 4-like n=1 Tax=Panagrellus redivivus TaxID=6233 RepID=A0A7E4W199_PANRE